MQADPNGDRGGFGGRRYRSTPVADRSYDDAYDDYLAFLAPRLARCRELLDEQGTLYLHLDYREAHYAKVELDGLFGRECFLNEIIWAYDYGGKPKRRWPAKHDTILVYVRDRDRYLFDAEAVEREPYMAPGLVTPEKAARGKLPTDVWWHTIVSPTGSREDRLPEPEAGGRAAAHRAGLECARRPGAATSSPGRGRWEPSPSSSAAASCLIDSNPEAMAVMERRLGITARRLRREH